MVLPDVLKHDLRVVFCGTAVSNASRKAKGYYAGSLNKFWPILAEIKLTPRLLKPSEFPTLLSLRIGLTDLVKTRSGSDDSLRREHFDIDGFTDRILKYAPGFVAFNGKTAGSKFLRRDVDYGRQPELIGDTITYVLPSTSNRANAFWNPDSGTSSLTRSD